MEWNRKMLRNMLHTMFLAVLAGVAISIGGCIYLSQENRIAGALMFTVGLYTICVHELNLYTGKVGYLVNQKPAYCLELLVIWIGNLLGAHLAALAMLESRIAPISQKAAELCTIKLDDKLLSLFFLGSLCGFLMFVAVDGYKKTQNPAILFAGIAAFIMCGFEHCVADMFYFSIAKMWSGKAFVCVLMVTLGNSVGGILIPLVKMRKMNDEKDIGD